MVNPPSELLIDTSPILAITMHWTTSVQLFVKYPASSPAQLSGPWGRFWYRLNAVVSRVTLLSLGRRSLGLALDDVELDAAVELAPRHSIVAGDRPQRPVADRD
jgi:hypothetical protein